MTKYDILFIQRRVIFSMKENEDKNKSAFTWFLSTVPICIAPFVFTYLFKSYTNGKWMDIGQYITDIVLIICSIACGLLVLVFDSSKHIYGRLKIWSRIYAVFVAVFSGCFYFYMIGFEKKTDVKVILFVGAILTFLCILDGWIFGTTHDKKKKQIDKERIRRCNEFFEEAIPLKYKNAFEGIAKGGFCEMTEVDPVERLKSEKKTINKNKR